MTLRVHFHTFILMTVKVYPSTFLLFYMSTDVPVHHYNCSLFLLFRHNPHNDLSTRLLGYLHTDPPEIKFTFTFMLLFRLTTKTYLYPQLLVYLPIDVPVHGPTCSFSDFHSDNR